ncbi:hypothetical protein Anapl_06978 [Anas platyrhynchos]|uniref:Uncharacterized protein n=1 Tax=Anas platyrhynchos TaxID=8839 RepID=R0M7S6_ANAPL|nr:hypothetical protein Anapl_06978 [Anas platyrhynchos]
MPNPTSTLEELTASLPITRTLHHGFVQLLMLHQLWMSGCISKHFKASLTRTHRCPGVPYFGSDQSISLRQDLLVDFILTVTRDTNTDLNHLNLANKQLAYIY